MDDSVTLMESPHVGAVFENYVISEELKQHLNVLKRPHIYFYRDDSRIEVDLVDTTDAVRPLLCELKSGHTNRASFMRSLAPVSKSLGFRNPDLRVVYGGDGSFSDGDVRVDGIAEWLLR